MQQGQGGLGFEDLGGPGSLKQHKEGFRVQGVMRCGCTPP